MRAELGSLEERIGYRFGGRELLHRALTHRSYVRENPHADGSVLQDNEQLEFLGDAVLGFATSAALVEAFPGLSEGRLSALKAALVSANHLHQVALRLEIGEYLELGHGEELSGGRSKKNLVVDAVEALIAAIYLDGGMDAARHFIDQHVIENPGGAAESIEEFAARGQKDFKTALQELAQSLKLPSPRYLVIAERGPEHSKTFTVEVRVGREWTGTADGLTKKSAAQRAARDVYERLLKAWNSETAEPRTLV